MEHLLSFNRLESEKGDCARSSIFGLRLLFLTLVLLLTFAAPVLADEDGNIGDGEPVISFTNVDPGKTFIDINGENLHDGTNDPTVILGLNGENDTMVDIPLAVQSIDGAGEQVVADLPALNPLTGNPFADGTYLITVIKEDDEKAEFHAVFGAHRGEVYPKHAVAREPRRKVHPDNAVE